MAKRLRFSADVRRRAGFTLVELMIVVLIITILATIMLFALHNAGESARKARTRAQIARIHDLLMPLWESYTMRRVPVNIPPGTHPSAAAATRVNGLREIMRFEMPDRISDVVSGSGTYTGPTLTTLTSHPALSLAYRRRAQAARTATGVDWSVSYQGAECLYLILSRLQDGESNGLEHFRADEISDLDGDGMPEVLDGWGGPIAFLRWAPGFVAPNSTLQNGTDTDPLDPLRVYPASFMLVPLIYSAGPDKDTDILTEATFDYFNATPKNSPFHKPNADFIGTPKDIDSPANGNGWADNIHNHLIDISIK